MWFSYPDTSQEPVLSDRSTPALGAPPRANQPGKALFGDGEHFGLALAIQYYYCRL